MCGSLQIDFLLAFLCWTASRSWEGSRVDSHRMFRKRSEAWDEAASLLGAEIGADGAIRGELAGYPFTALMIESRGLEGGTSWSTVFRVDLPELPDGLSLSPGKSFPGWWGPEKEFLEFDDPDWDSTHKVKAHSHQAAAVYLTPERRRAIMQATSSTSKGANKWFLYVKWRLDTAGLEVHTASAPRSPKKIVKGARATVALAEVLGPKK